MQDGVAPPTLAEATGQTTSRYVPLARAEPSAHARANAKVAALPDPDFDARPQVPFSAGDEVRTIRYSTAVALEARAVSDSMTEPGVAVRYGTFAAQPLMGCEKLTPSVFGVWTITGALYAVVLGELAAARSTSEAKSCASEVVL
jgi:hypothetical protein